MTDPTIPASATPTAPAGPTAPGAVPVVESNHLNGQSDLTAEEARQMIEWEKINVAMGRATPEQAAKAFDQLGATEAQRAPDTRSDEVKALDAAFPVAQPHEFVIRWNAPGDDTPMSPESKALDTSVRGWLTAAGFSVNNGQALVQAITEAKRALKGKTAAQSEQRDYDTFDRLALVHKGAVDARFDAVNRMIHAIEATHPGLYQFLTYHGLTTDAMVMNILANQAPIFHARKGR